MENLIGSYGIYYWINEDSYIAAMLDPSHTACLEPGGITVSYSTPDGTFFTGVTKVIVKGLIYLVDDVSV